MKGSGAPANDLGVPTPSTPRLDEGPSTKAHSGHEAAEGGGVESLRKPGIEALSMLLVVAE